MPRGFTALVVVAGLTGTSCLPVRKPTGSGALAAQAEASVRRLTMNDLSVLLPFASDAGFFAKTPKPLDLVDGQPLLAPAQVRLLDEALDFTQHSAPHRLYPFTDSLQPGNAMQLYLTALRFDPCFNIRTAQGDACQAQMRLVWQGYDAANNPADANVHEAFNLSRDAFQDVVQTLAALQASSGMDYTDAPLGPHPVLAKQGPDGAYFKGLVDLINRHARPEQLIAVAGLLRLTVDGATEWHMATLTYNAGTLVATPIFPVRTGPEQPKPTMQRFTFVHLVNSSGADPMPASPDAFATAQPPASLSEIGTYLTRINNVVNPKRHDVTDMDCSSCHEATRALQTASAFGLPASDPASVFPSAHNLNHDLVFTALAADKKNLFPILQMFSYRGPFAGRLLPVVQVRVIHETALALDYVHAHY